MEKINDTGRFLVRTLFAWVVFTGAFLLSGCSGQIPGISVPNSSSSSSSSVSNELLPSVGDTNSTATGLWVLKWHDEFNTNFIDAAKWIVRNSVWGGVACNYASNHVSAENGSLIIRTDNVPSGGYDYTSGFLSVQSNFAFVYGRIEVRAKLPIAANITEGMWPGIWLLAQDHSTGGYNITNLPPEIDVMEAVGNYPYKIWTTYHSGSYNSGNYGDLSNPSSIDFSAGCHVYAVEWESDAIRWYIDDVQVFQVTQQITSKPMVFILNTAVGNDGYMGIGLSPNTNNVFPQYHCVDYVRVYQRPL
jgi:beta-glucanase (GH16 family)